MIIKKKKIENCNFCKSFANEHIYSPIKSNIDSKLKICKVCGLSWLNFKKKKDETSSLEKFTRLSCDASYSPVRVGKLQMLQNFIEIHNFKIKKYSSILDMSAARGDFVRWSIKNLNFEKITALEPDKYMTKKFPVSRKLKLIHSQYQYLKFRDKFDLIYSCHSLEHYSDPEKKLLWVYENLKYGKYFYLEVPDPDIISHTKNIDEYFYDMHKFYFFNNLLNLKLIEIGFKILIQKKINGSICIFAKKNKPNSGYYLARCKNKKNYLILKKKVEQYKYDILNNRKKIIKQLRIDTRNELIVFGCGRILDYIINNSKFKKFFLSKKVFLVDNFLSRITKKLYGKKLYDEKLLLKKKNYDVLILAKSSNEKIIRNIKQIKKFKKIYTLADFLR